MAEGCVIKKSLIYNQNVKANPILFKTNFWGYDWCRLKVFDRGKLSRDTPATIEELNSKIPKTEKNWHNKKTYKDCMHIYDIIIQYL